MHLDAFRCSYRLPSKGARRAAVVCTRFILCNEKHSLCISLQHHCSDGPTLHPLRYLMAVGSVGTINWMASQVKCTPPLCVRIHSLDCFPNSMHPHPLCIRKHSFDSFPSEMHPTLRSHTPCVTMLCVQC